MSAPFVLAVPSKGRLQENTEAFFARAGLKLSKAGGARDYRGTIAGLDNVEVAYLSASEIASQLSRGIAHLGVTGEDLVRENIAEADKRVSLIEGLGFGYADVVVDITTTGATLAANGLRVLDDGVILRSQANLVASKDADWSPQARETARVILDHIAARARANKYREVRTRFRQCDAALLGEAHSRFGVETPFGGPTSSGMLTLHCPPGQLYALASFLREHGAETVSVVSLDYVFDRENPLFAKLEAFLRQ